MTGFPILAVMIAALLFLRRETFARLAYLIPAGLIAYAACGTGPLAYLAGWLALPPLFVLMAHAPEQNSGKSLDRHANARDI